MKKILFITRGINVDYQNDCIFHGLSSMPDVEVFILNENNYDFMFQGLTSDEFRSKLYGMGFTVTNRIPPERKQVHSREKALLNIQNRFYDYVVYGSIFRCNDMLDEVSAVYQRTIL